MKTAQDLIQELGRYVMPPPGVTIEVSEKPSHEPYDENWLASAGAMDATESNYLAKWSPSYEGPIVWSTGQTYPGDQVIGKLLYRQQIAPHRPNN
jgi:hypothetical protein